ncbi:8-oxo-dGTP pyrophosphatase MutT, NUDIX family [Litoreibacter ascidiaceicola]|uniref:8-oxo-dGTP pyrophosphatase MutT, NUDIX family n=1 Tax=Litoreibacter ascidiaceicola TaxID=1486859 RepID=A0A1M4ZX11_9RHOB|nr:NUDIX hydrolase [Litoreibacter ascidiaceicola]SHF22590.1 8-oxo-dGTP pyrophosphatase MutT, NUDIX family [Litoreibacter ascidiaceicola]
MVRHLREVWDSYLSPMLQRPKRLQVAALCYRDRGDDREVLLVTSRDTGRWIIPKGWPIRGLSSPEAAMQEAWEEAGVSDGHMETESIGTYTYDKTLRSGLPVAVETLVYSVEVENLEEDFPETQERRRKWVSPSDAAGLVHESELKSIFRAL